jgi:hypothetical protein
VAACLGAAAGLLAGDGGTGDYGSPRCATWGCDDPSRSLHALATGDIGGFFRFQPAMGLTSLALRAPAVLIAHAGGADTRGEYQAGAAVCLAVAAILMVWVAWIAWRRRAPIVAVLASLALWLVAIVWCRALLFGHPEEPLAAALAIAALATAATGRPLLAGVLVGLAIGTKEWALLVAPAVVFVGSRRDWLRVVAPALVVVVLAVGTMAVGNPSSFRAAHEGQRAGDKHTVTPANIWFRLGERRLVGQQGDLVFYEAYPPKLIGRWCRPFVIVLSFLLALLFVRRRGWQSLAAFALASMVLLARVVFDTQTFSYHLIPMLMAVAAWEVFARRRFPVVALGAMVAFQLTARVVSSNHDISSSAFNAIFLAWTLPLLVLLGFETYRRSSETRRA